MSLPGRRWEIRPRCFGTQKTARFSGKQTMAGWKIPILNRKYIVKNGGFYIANVRLPECTPKMVRAPQKSNTVDGSEILQTHQVIYGSLSHGFTRCLYICQVVGRISSIDSMKSLTFGRTKLSQEYDWMFFFGSGKLT